jgi:hypothetical protein
MEKRDYHMWSDDEDTVLVSLREAGHPVKHIAKVMERSVSSVTNRIYIKRVPLVARCPKPLWTSWVKPTR